MDQVKFTKMEDGDVEDYTFLNDHEVEYTKGTADRLLKALVNLDESLSGYQVTRLGHSIQSASRAWRDGADIDWIVSALLHDIGDIFAPYNHDEYAATILKPFVREQCRWVVEKHGDFQMIYYGLLVGGNQHKRDKFKDHKFFQDCAEFCSRWDQTSFDPSYPELPLEFFRPMVEEVFAREPYSKSIIEADPMPLFDAKIAKERAQ